MTTISELIKLNIPVNPHPHLEGKVTVVSSRLKCPRKAKASRKYECHVFNFLLKNKDALGIQEVFSFKNLLIDGAVLLADGKTRLAVEIKLRMNWTKACQAAWQIKQFVTRTEEAKIHPMSGAIVFFEGFQGSGWEKQAKSRLLQNGWDEWYLSYSRAENYRVDLFRICGKTFEDYESVRAAAEALRTHAQK